MQKDRGVTPRPIWLASYPRSGNTLLRTVLWHCFGLRSASIYPDDLGGNAELEAQVGHIEHGPDRRIRFLTGGLPLLKTHEHPRDDAKAIYVVRDGRAACVSLCRFYEGSLTLETIIEGNHRFGRWGDHLLAWRPWERPQTLLLRYEAIRDELDTTLTEISRFLERDITSQEIPDRTAIAELDGRWVKRPSDWRSEIDERLLARFHEHDGDILERLGYIV